MTSQVFADSAAQSEFDRRGYLVRPLLAHDDITQLTGVWRSSLDDVRSLPYSATVYSNNPSYRRAVSDAVARVLAAPLRALVPASRLLYGGFAAKAPGEGGAMPLHQDPSFVDEEQFYAMNVWIPLCDTHAGNGPLWVVPGSHRFNRVPRAFNQGFAYEAFETELRGRLAIPLHVRAGDAVFLSHTLFHFSPPNTTMDTRVAVGGVLMPEGASARYWYLDRESASLELYEVDTEFYFTMRVTARPTWEPDLRIALRIEPASLAEIERAAARAR